MNAIFSNLITTWRQIWRVLGIAQRASIILIGIAAIAAIGAILYWGSQPDWMVLYADIEPNVAAKVYEMARDDGIPVRLKDGGRTVLVPSRYVSDLRVRAEQAELGINRTGSGWELFDNVKLGLTEKQQQVGYQRAVQGELERMISEMPGIQRARVMLAIPPKRAVLRAEPQSVSASVMVSLQPGYGIDPLMVKSIRFMVSSAVPDLNPGEVTITDNHGRLLAGRESISGAASSTHLETQALLEEQLRQKVESILIPITGPEQVVATVSVDLDADQIDRLMETYDADRAVIVSERVISEESEKTDSKQQRAAGAASNIVSVDDPSGSQNLSGNATQQARKTVENQYLVPKTVEKMQRQGVRIRQLSVAVTIARAPDAEPRTPQQLDQLRELVASSVGAVTDPASGRQDVVRIMEEVFAPGVAAFEVPPASLPTRLQDYMTMFSFLRPLGAVALLFVFYLIFRRQFNRARGDEIMVGSEQLSSDNVMQLGSDQKRNQILPEEHKEAGPLDLIRQRSEKAPSEVGDAVEAMLRAELD